MLFAAGIGTILMFWGVAEPMSHFANPPLQEVAGGTPEAAKLAMTIALYHFGLHTWTIFTLPALAIGYFAYRQGLPMRISSIFYTVLGNRIFGPWGWCIDIIAVLGTLFGVAVSVGLGTLQLNSGLHYLLGLPTGASSQIGIVAVITLIATVSVALGLDRGIKRLSEFNIVIALIILLFVWLAGPTLFVTAGTVENFGNYLQNLPWLAFWTETYQGTDWQRNWTVFYWAWTISWAPYVGIFIARISKGRTYPVSSSPALLLVPTLGSALWFSVLGGAAIVRQMEFGDLTDSTANHQRERAVRPAGQPARRSDAVRPSPFLLVTIFFVTSSDSGSLVVDMLASGGNPEPPTWSRVMWAVIEGLVAISLMLAGGLAALQTGAILTAVPFSIIMIAMCFATYRAAQGRAPRDPAPRSTRTRTRDGRSRWAKQ